MPVTSLNLELAVRYYVDSVSYSTPTPPWLQWGPSFPYADIASRLQDKLSRELTTGQLQDVGAFRMAVPYRGEDYRTWVMPAVNEQIIVHACAMYISRNADGGGIDSSKVYSYANEPWENDFLEEQLQQWLAFQTETTQRLTSSSHILQIDLRHAFAHIDRDDFFAHFRAWVDDDDVLRVLKAYVNTWAGDQPGIPFVNDSLFYLGNVYFDTVDRILMQHTENFIRFMDDYRIFGNSKAELEGLYEALSQALQGAGFEINEKKVLLGSSAEYFRAAAFAAEREDERSRLAYEKIGREEPKSYLGPLLFTKVIDPAHLVDLIEVVASEPSRFLTVRVGRLLMREIRKLRTNATIGSAVHRSFVENLSANRSLREKLNALVLLYASQGGEEWRLVWLLYVLADLILLDDTTGPEYLLVKRIVDLPQLHPVARLWALRVTLSPRARHNVEDIFDHFNADYLTAGKQLYPEARQ